jgi:hypothetical protein
MMSKLSVMEQLHSEWLTAHAAWEQGQKEVNETMLQFCLGKGRAPTRKVLDAVNVLFNEMCETRTQLDNFMREYIASPNASAMPEGHQAVTDSFLEAARMAQT